MTDDRRQKERVEACLDAIWEGSTGKYSARITDLSESGCYVDAMCEAYVGERVTFSINLPNGDWLALSGEVAHYSPRLGFGVYFVNLTDEQREGIGKLINTVSPES